MAIGQHSLVEENIVKEHHGENRSKREIQFVSGAEESTKIDDSSIIDKNRSHLTGQEIWNIVVCFFAWACNVSIVTLVIGTSNNVFLSIGGDVRLMSLPLGAFLFGSAFISCGITEPLFRRGGRRKGLMVGNILGVVATILGILSVYVQSPAINNISTFVFGTANGIGYYIRFAIMENVPQEWAARAVALVVSGGVIAAFAGPEAGQATRGMFGDNYDDSMYYMGVFIMTGVFNVLNLICIAVVKFNPLVEPAGTTMLTSFFDVYKILLVTRSFLVPMMRATIGWIVMAVPMSVIRIAMQDAGFTPRESLLVIELHFSALYAPGVFTGSLIHFFGERAICFVGWIINCISVAILIVSKDEVNGSVIPWIIGMILLGIGWNFQFTGTTVWLNHAVNDVPFTKGQIQAANDFLMFLISGTWNFGASFVYDGGFWGNGVSSGWMTLNYCVIAFLVADFVVILADYYFQRLRHTNNVGNHIEGFARGSEDEEHATSMNCTTSQVRRS